VAIPQQQPPEEDHKSELRKIAEHKAKQAIKKKGQKVAKKFAKKAAKLALKAVKKGVAVLAKMLLSFLASIGLPTILIALGILLLLLVTFLLSSVFFGNGKELDPNSQELYEYMEDKAYSTVNMSNPEQVPYRVPIQLIASAIQIHGNSETIETEDDAKKIIKKMSNELAPTFEYNQFNEWREKQVTVCEDGVCNEGPVIQTDNFVDKLTFINAWNGQTTITYEERITPWVTNTQITYKTETYTDTVKYTDFELQPYTVIEQIPIYGWTTVTECDVWACWKVPVWGIARYEEKEIIKYREVPVSKNVEIEKERQIEIKTITKTRKRVYDGTSNYVEGYSALDQVLNTYGYGIQDKQLVEAFYQGSAEASELPLPPINYTNWLNSVGLGSGGIGVGFDGTIIPGAGVPAQYMEYYRSAEQKYGVDWFLLAAIHFTETAFSTHPSMLSSVGAVGHMQFMPATWAGWRYNTGGGLVSSSTDITNLNVIRAGNGYGIDANGDGKADPWDMEDAIYTAAHYLSKNGYATDQRKAVFAYNHAEWYVNKVLTTASSFRDQAVYQPSEGMPVVTDGAFMRPSKGYVTSSYGMRSGGMHHGIDIGNNGQSTPIVSVADGTVSRSYLSSSYGNVVYIKHTIEGQTYETVYAHMTNRAVTAGQKVTKGQFLGNMGTTGRSTGVHLHFEIHRGQWTGSKSNSLNPALYIPF
jgi:hypothetical protein